MRVNGLKRATRKRVVLRGAAAFLALMLSPLILAGPARADGDNVWVKNAPCATGWNWFRSGATFRVARHVNVSTIDRQKMILDGTHMTVDTLRMCNAAGPIKAYSIHMAVEYFFAVDGLPQCNFGIPLGINCTVTASEIVVSKHRACQYEKDFCEIIGGHEEFRIPYGQSIRRGGASVRTSVTMIRSDGNSWSMSEIHKV